MAVNHHHHSHHHHHHRSVGSYVVRHNNSYVDLENFIQNAQEEIGKVFEQVDDPTEDGSSSWFTKNDHSKSNTRQESQSTDQISKLLNGCSSYGKLEKEPNNLESGTREASVCPSPPINSTSAAAAAAAASLGRSVEQSVERTHSDASMMKNKRNEPQYASLFARPPSFVEDEDHRHIDLLKCWADSLVEQVNEAFTSLESLDNERELCNGPSNSTSIYTIPGFVNKESDAKECDPNGGDNEESNLNGLNYDVQTISNINNLKMCRSSTSSTSSSSQVRPEELVCFLKRVEESIHSSHELSDSVFAADDDDDEANNDDDDDDLASKWMISQDATTQTSPTISRTSSTLSSEMLTKKKEDGSEDGEIRSFQSLSSMERADEEEEEEESSSSLSCLSDEIITSSSNSNEGEDRGFTDAHFGCSDTNVNSKSEVTSGATIPREVRRVKNEMCSDGSLINRNSVENNSMCAKAYSVPILRHDDSFTSCSSQNDGQFKSLPATVNRDPKISSVKSKFGRFADQIAELEAIEACTWLRAAGFPQYAQMYEDHQFPVDIDAAQKDHYFLDQDAIQSLFRRLNTLNKCAKMKISNLPRQATGDESEDDDLCALSENWMFLKSNRRWSRVNQDESEIVIGKDDKSCCSSPKSLAVPKVTETHSSFDSVLTADDYSVENGGNSPAVVRAARSTSAERNSQNELQCNLNRSGSERFKDGAKALLKRMESFKSRRRKRYTQSNRDAMLFDDSVGVDTDPVKSNRLKPPQLVLGMDDDDEVFSSSQRKNGRPVGAFRKLDNDALSDSECSSATSPSAYPTYLITDPNSNNALDQYWRKCSRLSPPSPKSNQSSKDCSPEIVRNAANGRASVYDNVPVVFFNQNFPSCENKTDTFDQVNDPQHLDGVCEANKGSLKNLVDDEAILNRERRDSGVGLSLSRQSGTKVVVCDSHIVGHISLDYLSSGQLMVLRKLSLLKLTALIEKYSPSNRGGWNWAMPKFIKRIKSPDYKDKQVFGLPLLLVLQRTGQPLPTCIQSAIDCLRKVSIDSVGLFRKSGVRSRIQHLKNLTENHQDKVNYENYQAYDVADLMKQYFRELPEALLTNKLSETFITIFQHIPTEMRFEAMQAALMLMPDENRQVLQSLLTFLCDVSNKASENQMTASNLAVCLAPSLFHLSLSRNSSNSPRRRKTLGAPDQKELKESKAAHECLTQMITHFSRLFSVAEEMLNQCRYSFAEYSNVVTLDDLVKTNTQLTSNWERYVDNCIQVLFRDARSDRYLSNSSKGWTPFSYSESCIDISYKKQDGRQPLRVWRLTTDVEAPPAELLNKVLREREVWDDSLINWRIVNRVDANTEIYQYVAKTMISHPNRDFCAIRTWRTDLTRGSCILIETSIDHPDASLVSSNCVRGTIMASRYLIEPCGSGKSRITHISRADLRGKSPEWYNRAYGHLMARNLLKLRESFKHGTDGPETKV